MSISKVIEISCQSEESFEDAIRQGIQAAAKSVRNIKSAWVKEQQVVVEDDRVVKYRVDLKISFVIAWKKFWTAKTCIRRKSYLSRTMPAGLGVRTRREGVQEKK